MDSFEQIISAVLQRKGYWTQTSVKVELTKAEKRRIGRHSSPRWELDVVAYKGSTNELLVVECKSLLDSPGVKVSTFQEKHSDNQDRYKLFFDRELRTVVLRALARQLVKKGLCRSGAKARLGLAAGNVSGDPEALRKIFTRKGWVLYDPKSIVQALRKVSGEAYENSALAIVVKLLERTPREENIDG